MHIAIVLPMRFGLHCAGDRVVAAAHDRGAIRGEVSVPLLGGDPLAATVQLLSKLGDTFPQANAHGGATSLTFEVSEMLKADIATPAHLIRISPRSATGGHDPFSLPWLAATGAATPMILHLPGGHDARGQEIVALNASGLKELPPATVVAPRFVVTAVGSLLNPEHELQVGASLLAKFPGANIEYGHSFHHTSFAVRERTAYVNLALREQADAIVTSLSVAASSAFPRARLLVATNCGGSIPLTRLAVTPVDAAASLRATEAVGAAAFLGATSGALSFEVGGTVQSCELDRGLPSVVPALQSESFGKLATPASNVRTASSGGEDHAHAEDFHTVVIPHHEGLAARGAANLPRVDWTMSLIQIANETEMIRAKEAAESRLHARLVSTGVPPEQVRTVESLVTATSYGNPEVIALRIRAIAHEERPLAHNDLAVSLRGEPQ